MLQAPKVHFYDTGLVEGDEGIRFENLVATALLKYSHWQNDVHGLETGLHYVRTKDGAEVNFALSNKSTLTRLIECKWADDKPHRALQRFASENPLAQAIQVVRELRHSFEIGTLQMANAAQWPNGLGV